MRRYPLSPGYWWLGWKHSGYTFKVTPLWAWFYHQAGRFMSDEQLFRLAQSTLR